MIFPEADQPWIPTLLDVERYKGESPDSHYWKKFGWDQLEIPDDASHVQSRMDILEGRFIASYGWRRLAFETMEQWQTKLQEKMDAVVEKYERAYQLYETNHDAMMSDVLPGQTVTTKGTIKASGDDVRRSGGSDSTTAKTKTSDTPDSAINSSDNFAGEIGISNGSTTYGKTDTTTHGRTDTTDLTETTIRTGAEIMQAINESIDGWMDIDTAFIHEFANLFSNIWWD